MAYLPELDGPTLAAWARRAANHLEARSPEINRLNVFPIPDSDTGSNMAHTMQSAVSALANLPERATAAQVTTALTRGAVAGARGNSGMVLSQVLRSLAEESGDTLGAPEITAALHRALELVRGAIARPVEGTVLSVLRAAAEAASRHRELHGVVTAAAEAAHRALAKTPAQLPALKGVVDAGGQGLVVLIDALRDSLTPPTAEPHLEVMFAYRGDKDALREALEPLGTSLIIAPDGTGSASVHIHSRRSGELIERAFGLGEVNNLRLEALPEPPEEEAPGVIAVVPTGSMERLFRDAGAEVISPGSRPQREAIVLPNGLSEIGSVGGAHVVPTTRLVEGIAALAVYDPEVPRGEAVQIMRETVAAMRTAEVHDPAALAETCRELLRPGGELVTLLVRPDVHIDAPGLSAQLGVELMAYRADNLTAAVEIGVE
ncbi:MULTISPECIES: DAK2 domain-containing protein [unclassified Corynebacterium]|uniref:DAK2 domain-containing protein n=1 Tax=unclassified Corynebacterium TaxID=2624378 RepID=UPI0029CA71C3|nr:MULTISPECIES: DAK2 domain-containing protein [unclassified Corynebacterium]WPF67082.1 DAK2 domain-containing protein [Corynebacterium sp. 22KM0430]WPF69570.1 DAK2 domain-containing protein [Corynebacterium sp. 21KM1197]